MKRRTLPEVAGDAPLGRSVTSPLVGAACVDTTVDACGEYLEGDGFSQLSVRLSREVARGSVRLSVHSLNRPDRAALLAAMLEDEFVFRSGAAARAFIALLVSAAAEAERRGLLGTTARCRLDGSPLRADGFCPNCQEGTE